MGINRLKAINQIIRIFAGNTHRYLSVEEVTKILNNELDSYVPVRTVKQHIQDIEDHFEMSLDKQRGRDGGFQLSKESKQSLADLAHMQLSKDERNAIHDAFEIAEQSTSFNYHAELQTARQKLFTKMVNLNEYDYEHYIGNPRINDVSKLASSNIKLIKASILSGKRILLAFKYIEYGATQELEEYKPFYIIHDTDESFVVLKRGNNEPIIQNVLNIQEIKQMDKPFNQRSIPKISEFINKHSIQAKGEHPLEFIIVDDEGMKMYDLWNYEFEEIERTGTLCKIVFYEEYKVFEFLLRMQPHIANLKMSKSLHTKWKSIIDDVIKNINQA